MDFEELDHMPTVKVAMTTFPFTIDIDAPLSQARATMREHGIRHLPVTEKGSLVGVLSERDLGLVESSSVAGGWSDGLAVRNACVLDAFIVGLDAPLDYVLQEMADRHIGSALVVKSKKLVGILTQSDACRLLAGFLRARFPTEEEDGVA
jgi:acetoin utilization protein AcuB